MNDLKLDLGINEDSKILIGLGDSFCAGSGSQPIEIWEKYNWNQWELAITQEATEWGYKNSFIQKLCDKHLKDYIPVNLGHGAKGNRFAIRELFLNPQLNIEIAKEKIVILVLSGIERLDLADDICFLNSGGHTSTIWPYNHINDKKDRPKAYSNWLRPDGRSLYSDEFVISEFIFDLMMLKNWCSLNNAKLLIVSGFDWTYDKESFKNILSKRIHNALHGEEVIKNIDLLLNKLPWENFIKPMGYDTIMHMLLHLEGDKQQSYVSEIKTISENHYITKCGHPSYKGHAILSDVIYEKLKEFNYV
jgi:hypothetical protein